MLLITTAFYASLHKYSVIVILGILPLLLHTASNLNCCYQQWVCVLTSTIIIILMLIIESLSLMRSTQSLSHIP